MMISECILEYLHIFRNGVRRHLGKFTYKAETPLYRLYNIIILLYYSIVTLLFSSDLDRIPDTLRKPVVSARVFVLIAFSDEKTHRSVNIKT